MLKIGDRVAVILKNEVDYISNNICYFLGYGIYEGAVVPELKKETKKNKLHNKLCRIGFPANRFKLDNGEIFYDYECWFMSEERFKKAFVEDEYHENWKVILVDRKGKKVKEKK